MIDVAGAVDGDGLAGRVRGREKQKTGEQPARRDCGPGIAGDLLFE